MERAKSDTGNDSATPLPVPTDVDVAEDVNISSLSEDVQLDTEKLNDNETNAAPADENSNPVGEDYTSAPTRRLRSDSDEMPRESDRDTGVNQAECQAVDIAIDRNKTVSSLQTVVCEDTKSQLKTDADALSKQTEGAAAAQQSTVDDRSPAASASKDEPALAPIPYLYHVKWIKYKGNQTAIITQNENGPCPLLAIMNCLLLRGKVKLPLSTEIITSAQLMDYLADCIFENAPRNLGEENRLNYEQNMSDALAVFDRLQTGLDVNVRFTGVREFEYTRECIVFDLLGIHLYHGWLADPQHATEMSAVGQCTYNQLVEKIIEEKNSQSEQKLTEALVAEDFLSRSCHQLTYHGLSELSSQVTEKELAVLFRNNHFSTLLKHRNELFTLVTDQGFLSEANVVWETLSNVEGDGHFVDAEFHTYRKPEVANLPAPASSVPANSEQQIDHDYMVALSLQEDTGATVPTRETTAVPTFNQTAVPLTDHELAMRLQEEEDRQASVMLQQQQQQQQQASGSRGASGRSSQSRDATRTRSDRASEPREKKESNCSIL